MGLSQQQLADKTGIPKDRIAKWETGKANPKGGDTITLMKFFNTNVPREPVLNEDHQTYINQDKGVNDLQSDNPASMQVIMKLSESNRLIAESNASMSESNRILARSNEELVQLVKSSTANASEQTQLTVESKLAGLQEWLLEVAVGKRWKSKQEAHAVLHKLLFDVGKDKKQEDIQTGSGMPSKR